MAYWRCNGLTNGSISLAHRQRTPVVNGYFQASESPALEARLLRAGHVKVKDSEALGASMTPVSEPEIFDVDAVEEVVLEPEVEALLAVCEAEGIKTTATTAKGVIAALERNDVDWQDLLSEE